MNKNKLKRQKVNNFIDCIALQKTPTDIRSYIDVESKIAYVDDNDNQSGYNPLKQSRPTFNKTPEPPTSVSFTPAGIDIFDKR